jgi:hypothetical protein
MKMTQPYFEQSDRTKQILLVRKEEEASYQEFPSDGYDRPWEDHQEDSQAVEEDSQAVADPQEEDHQSTNHGTIMHHGSPTTPWIHHPEELGQELQKQKISSQEGIDTNNV